MNTIIKKENEAKKEEKIPGKIRKECSPVPLRDNTKKNKRKAYT